MAKIDVLDILRTKKQTPLEFDYDNLWIPPMHFFLTPDDVESLRRIATSLRLSSKIEVKYKMIDDIMRNRGFKRFSAGTNRVVYCFLEDTRFVVKIAVDKVGMQDNPMEFKNQSLLKPYCAKMFYISPCGTVGFAERVLPIKNKKEFKEIAPDVFEILVNKILGKYVVEDVGTKYFMNWGIRKFDAPVLLDYPFIYKLDGKKLFCNKVHPLTNEPCNGEIDYDAGFNHLTCTRCGKIYLATDLRDNSIDNRIIIKGGIQMRIILKKGDEIIRPIPSDEVMARPRKKPEYKTKGLIVRASGGNIINNQELVEKPNNINKTSDHDFDFNTESKFITNSENSDSTDSADISESEKNGENTETKLWPEDYTETMNADTDSPISSDEDENQSTDTSEDNGTELDIVDPEDSNSVDEPKITVLNEEDEIEDNGKSELINIDDSISDSNYDDFDNDEPTYKPIRRKSNVERDANGRFTSSGKKKSSSAKRIPSNK